MEENDPQKKNQLKEKIYSHIVYVGIISSIMLFAGLSSAVLVRKMDKFWVNIHLPEEFMISTVLIMISSLSLFLALKFTKKNHKKFVNVFISLTFLLGLCFCFFQFKGWKHYYENGNAPKSYVTYVYGQYGQSFQIYKEGEPIIYNGDNYEYNGEELNVAEVKSLRDFAYQICGDDRYMKNKAYEIKNYKDPFVIYSMKDTCFVDFIEGVPYKKNNEFSSIEKDELFKFAFGVFNNKPFFMLDGKYGEDFSISLNGVDLEYKKKKFYFPERDLTELEKSQIEFPDAAQKIEQFTVFVDGNPESIKKNSAGEWVVSKKELNSAQYNELYQTTNISSSFVWVLTVLHFVHILLGLIVLLIISIKAIKGNYNCDNYGGLKAGGIFWHFLGGLWVYLYVFLEYIN